ncbi:MAG: hypothetical protein IPK03_16890 [Bacteroidetes bacterium]|nr:hypothetical protein [Bacteroidota bacterium]
MIRWNIAQWFEKRWWKDYLSKQNAAEYIQWKERYWHLFIQKIGIHVLPNQVIYDYGCGPAGINIIYPEHAVYAVDPLIEDYQRDYPALFPPSKIVYSNSTIEDFKPTVLGDWIFSINCINHVNDLEAALAIIAQSGKEDATYIISTDLHSTGFFNFILKYLPFDILHPIQLNYEEYMEDFHASGLVVERSIKLKTKWMFEYWVFVLKKHSSN